MSVTEDNARLAQEVEKIDPVILRHEADAAWSVMRHHESQALIAKTETEALRRQSALARPKVKAFTDISKLIAFRKAGWFEVGDPQSPDEVLDRIAEAIVIANQEVQRITEAQQKKAQAS